MNDPRLQKKEFQSFTLSKDSTVLVRLSNYVQFIRAPPNLYEEFLSNKNFLGHNGDFCLLQVISNCATVFLTLGNATSKRYPKSTKERLVWCKFEMDS